MNLTVKKEENLKKKEISLSISIPYEEVIPFLEKTAKKMNKTLKVDGFRSGTIPFDIVKKQVGEMNLLQYSMEDIIDKTLHKTIEKEGMHLYITPKIDVEKIAPGNPIEYKATAYLLPELTLKGWDKISVKEDKVKVSKKEIDESLKNVIEYLVTEKEVDRASKTGDTLVMDFDVLVDKVLIENGSAKDFQLQTGKDSMIPGFEDKVMGTKAGDEKTFELSFPKEYPHKMIAGKKAEFQVKTKKVLERVYPEINDELAKQLKYKDLKELNNALESNLEGEAKKKVEFKVVNDIFDALLKKAKFDLIHEVFIEAELKKMLQELKHNVEKQGGKYDDYLAHLKKTEEDLLKEMHPEGEKRVQISLIIKDIVENNEIKVTDKDIDTEIENYLKSYGQNAGEEARKTTESKRFRHYIEQTLVNKKAIDFLKETLLKKTTSKKADKE